LHPALPLLSTSCKLASAVRATIGIESGAIGANSGRTVFRPAMPHAQPPSSTARPTPRPSNSARRAAKRQFDRNRVVAGKLTSEVSSVSFTGRRGNGSQVSLDLFIGWTVRRL
jgi:hypothetical protein